MRFVLPHFLSIQVWYGFNVASRYLQNSQYKHSNDSDGVLGLGIEFKFLCWKFRCWLLPFFFFELYAFIILTL